MSGQVSSSYGSLSGTGTDQHYVPLDQATCFLYHVVCQRVRRVYPFLLWGILRMAFFGFLASLLCLVCLGGASFAGPPFAHKTWITLVCLLLGTPFLA